MPSNHFTHVCIPCRNVVGYGLCPECGAERKSVSRWSAPKKNNDRAWRRIEKGEWLWDRRRVARSRGKGRDTYKTWETIVVIDEDCDCGDFFCRWRHVRKHTERVPGSEREVTNYSRLPDVDMGG